MDKYKKYIVWGGFLLVVSCSNLAGLCRHQLSASKTFNYKGDAGMNGIRSAPVFVAAPGNGQSNSGQAAARRIHWDTLADVTFRARYNKEFDMEIYYPLFGRSVKKLNGQELYIRGYIIPLNPAEGLYAISRFNYASCFFCGGAGPESIISLKFKTKPRRYKTDEYLAMKGRMELNDSNFRDFIYIFRDTEEFTAP